MLLMLVSRESARKHRGLLLQRLGSKRLEESVYKTGNRKMHVGGQCLVLLRRRWWRRHEWQRRRCCGCLEFLLAATESTDNFNLGPTHIKNIHCRYYLYLNQLPAELIGHGQNIRRLHPD
jgi:hypothetical protein